MLEEVENEVNGPKLKLNCSKKKKKTEMNRLKLFNYQTKPNISFIGVKLPLSWIRDSQNL